MNGGEINSGEKAPMNNAHYEVQPEAHPSPAPTIPEGGHKGESLITPPGEPTSATKVPAEALDSRDLQIAQLTLKLAESERQQRDLQLRHLAEKQNSQRRAEQDIEKAHKFSLEKIARALLPVLDSFERAVALANRENAEAMPMIEGLDLTLKSLNDTLHKFGIEAVGEPGVPFDPERHQAMTLVDSALHQSNHIVTVMQKGYTLNGRLLRAAMVTVARSVDT